MEHKIISYDQTQSYQSEKSNSVLQKTESGMSNGRKILKILVNICGKEHISKKGTI